MKVKQPGTNIMVITFVLTSLINERKATRNEYNGHNICSGLYINESRATGIFIMAIIFVPRENHHYMFLNLRQTGTKYMAITFILGSLLNECKATRTGYNDHIICSGLFDSNPEQI